MVDVWEEGRLSLRELIADCRRLIDDLDAGQTPASDPLFYQMGYEELRLNLGLLLDALEADPPRVA